MDEELKKEPEEKVSIESETSAVESTPKKALDNLPRFEDLQKSEKDVKTSTKIEGLEQVYTEVKSEDRVFVRKEDQKKAFLKKRMKVVAGVYVSIVALVLAFVGINLATMFALDQQINTNTITIAKQESSLDMIETPEVTTPEGLPIEISLNEPRDYNDDTKELTFLDKLTILFRNLFS